MNYARLGIAAVVATIVDGIYGFAVYGTAMSGLFGTFPGVFRSTESQASYLPVMFVGIFIGMVAVSYIYAKGYEGGSGIQEGLRFGLLIGIFNAGYVIGTDYGILNIGAGLAASMAVAGLMEWILVGLAIGAVYRPAPARGGV